MDGGGYVLLGVGCVGMVFLGRWLVYRIPFWLFFGQREGGNKGDDGSDDGKN